MLRANWSKYLGSKRLVLTISKDVDLKKREQIKSRLDLLRWEGLATCSSCQSSILGTRDSHYCPYAYQRHDSISSQQLTERALAYFFCHLGVQTTCPPPAATAAAKLAPRLRLIEDPRQ